MALKNITGDCPIPHYYAKGKANDIFWQLGELDHFAHRGILREITNLLRLDMAPVDFLIKKSLNLLSKKVARHLIFEDYFHSYLKGVKIKEEELLSAYLVPEVITALKKFLPKLPAKFLACSTLFSYEPLTASPIHGRVLDFPINQNYLKSERGIIYALKDYPKIWSLSLAGVPFPGITAMNDEGVTIALHMKYGDTFNLQGHSIFEIIFKILLESKNHQDVIKILKEYKAISSWGLYLTFKDGKGMAVDLYGNNFSYELFDLQSKEPVYGNNAPIESSLQTLGLSPGLNQYCSMRKRSALEKIKNNKEVRENSSSLEVLKLLAHPYSEKHMPSQNWTQDTCTITSVHIAALNGKGQEVYLTPGDTPKLLEDKAIKLEKFFAPEIAEIEWSLVDTGLPKIDPRFKEGHSYFAQAGSHYEQKNIHEAFHYIQLAIDAFEGYPEQKITTFYFLMLKMIHFENEKDLALLLKKFRDIQPELPPYMAEHALLAEARIERLLHGKTTIEEFQISTEELKRVFKFEQSIPLFLLKKMRSFITLQMGTMDVIYTYPV